MTNIDTLDGFLAISDAWHDAQRRMITELADALQECEAYLTPPPEDPVQRTPDIVYDIRAVLAKAKEMRP